MPRIQILELPSEEVGNVSVTPFALILDQCEYLEGVVSRDELDAINESFRQFARKCGARASLATNATIEVPGLTADEIATINRPFAEGIRDLVEAIKPPKIGVHYDTPSP